MAMPLVAALAVSIAVTWSDYKFADASRIAAAQVKNKYQNQKRDIWFEGHWGFQYYMESVGARPLADGSSWLAHGDIVIVPHMNTNLFPLPEEWAVFREAFEVGSRSWLSTMNPAVGAGFYADAFGPLPFAIGKVPAEGFSVVDVVLKGASK